MHANALLCIRPHPAECDDGSDVIFSKLSTLLTIPQLNNGLECKVLNLIGLR